MSNATNYLLRYLLKHRMEVYFWRESVLHAKLACIDEKIVSIGSFNLNNLSSLLSIEVNARITNTDFALAFKHHLTAVFAQSEAVDASIFTKESQGIWPSFRDWFSYKLMKWTLGFFRFIPRVLHPFNPAGDVIP